MRRFVIGDIHGRFEALKEVLAKCSFNYDEDLLIVLGDIVDGGEDTYHCVEELLKINNVILILGNHDKWFIDHIKTGWAEEIWLGQGGRNTLISYINRDQPLISNIDDNRLIPITHQIFFNHANYYYILDDMLFVHGGFSPKKGIEKTEKTVILWDRDLINYARKFKIDKYKKVFIGHTATNVLPQHKDIINNSIPLKFNNLIMMDTGAGWNGKLSIMNIDTEEYWQSEKQKPAVRNYNEKD